MAKINKAYDVKNQSATLEKNTSIQMIGNSIKYINFLKQQLEEPRVTPQLPETPMEELDSIILQELLKTNGITDQLWHDLMGVEAEISKQNKSVVCLFSLFTEIQKYRAGKIDRFVIKLRITYYFIPRSSNMFM